MSLERAIALLFLALFILYGYTAFFTMDASLAPFMRRNPIWPSTFPKGISVLGILASLYVLLGFESAGEQKKSEIDYRNLGQYKIGQALILLALMIAYALLLRPAGFLLSTVLFLVLSAWVLGERRIFMLLIVSFIATGVVWYLVQQVLGIFLRPLPFFLG
ncbi:MAG: tripartite tricarboxylate transporter TctB family protein [Acidiferrobacterales bacterium]|nr:tripartite tricarboxylate transporter TctB family protein [Acidiferrobacterales bacterium]